MAVLGLPHSPSLLLPALTYAHVCMYLCLLIIATRMPMTHGDIILHNSLNGICSYCLTVDGLTNQTSCRGKVIASEGMGMGMGMEAVPPLFQVGKCNVHVKHHYKILQF